MLGLILHTRFTAPADHQQAGHGIDIRVHQRSEGIDSITQAAVLHITQARPAGCQIVPGAKGNGTAFVMSDNMRIGISTVTGI